MTHINFNCPHCRNALQIDPQGAGLQMPCPYCGITVAVPCGLQPAPHIEKQRPTSVTVFGILNIVFGGLGLLCMPFTLIASFVFPDVLHPSAGFKMWIIFTSVVSLGCSIWLLVLGIGLLNLKRWSRTGSIAYGWFQIVFGIIGLIVNFGAVLTGGLTLSAEAIPGFIGGIFGGLIALAYPVLLLVFMNRPTAVAACTGC